VWTRPIVFGVVRRPQSRAALVIRFMIQIGLAGVQDVAWRPTAGSQRAADASGLEFLLRLVGGRLALFALMAGAGHAAQG